MQQTVAKCFKVWIFAQGIQIPSLLDFTSNVPLLQQLCFEKQLLPKRKPTVGGKAEAHFYNAQSAKSRSPDHKGSKTRF